MQNLEKLNTFKLKKRNFYWNYHIVKSKQKQKHFQKSLPPFIISLNMILKKSIWPGARQKKKREKSNFWKDSVFWGHYLMIRNILETSPNFKASQTKNGVHILWRCMENLGIEDYSLVYFKYKSFWKNNFKIAATKSQNWSLFKEILTM